MKLKESRNFQDASILHEKSFAFIGESAIKFIQNISESKEIIFKELTENGSFLGYIIYKHNKGSHELFIEWMAIIKEKRNLGLGKVLVNDAIEYAKNKDCKSINLVTRDCFQEALRLYYSFGFELVSSKKDRFSEIYKLRLAL